MSFKADKKVYIAILFYIIWVVVYLTYDFQREKKETYQRLDNQLEISALSLPQILPPSFHRQDMQASDITPAADRNNILQLTDYTKTSEAFFLYSMILRDNKVIFTSSSATDEKLQSGEGLVRYFDHYAEAPAILHQAFADKQKRFLELTNRWGTFRSIFIPIQTTDGSIFIAAADIKISHIEAILASYLPRKIAVAGIFLLFLIPFVLAFSYAQRRWASQLENRVVERTEKLHESEQKLNSILEYSPVGIFHYDTNGVLVTINKRFTEIAGADQSTLIGFNMLEKLVDKKLLRAVHDSLNGQVGHFEGPYVSVSGERSIYLIAEFVPMLDNRGELTGGVAVFDDATERENATNNLKKLSLAVEQSPNLIVITDVNGVIEYINPRFTDITGYSAVEVIGQTPSIISSSETPPEVYEDLWKTLLAGQEWRGVFHNRKKSGELYWAKEIISPITNSQGEITHFIAQQEDITEVRRISDEISYQSSHDALTGLLNRREFEKRLARVVRDAQQQHSHHALCFIDIDQFKVVNDTCGHLAGDELLRQVSNILRDELRSRDTLARPGGDEFLLLMEHCSLAQAEKTVQQMLESLKSFRFQWQDRSFSVELSIGLTTIDAQTKDATSAIKEVDTACYTAKDAGRNRIHIYREDDELQVAHKGYIQWANEIREALDSNRFRLYAQPIRALQKQQKPGFEILIRLLTPSNNLIAPGAFLPAAERYNLATQIDRWVINNTLKWMIRHQEQLEHIDSLSINLSGQSLGDEGLLGYIIRTLESASIPIKLIKFEITETAAIANMRDAQIFIKSLRNLGCQFALDDFGSGLSSFAYLKNLPVDFLKIDGMFVKDILNDPIDEAMVRSINEIGHIMQMKTIAEFVESEEIRQRLTLLGVDYGQGYGISKPVPIDEILNQEQFASADQPAPDNWQI
ncbi:MAG: EAL domain-containing protein [Amphritea sp.]